MLVAYKPVAYKKHNVHSNSISCKSRSSRLELFWKKGVVRNFAKFIGKHLCQSLFFNKDTDLRPVTLLKKTLAQVFSCEFCEISKKTFFNRTPPVAASEN